MSTEFRVLGPLEVRSAGKPIAVPAGKARVLLAALLLRAGEVVPADELVERLWEGGAPDPARARAALHMTVARLRRSLGPANVVRTATGGYLADVPADALDLHLFRSWADAGRYADALGLWRGAPLSDVRSDALHRLEVAPLEEERLVVLERRIDADLAAGGARELVAELRSLTRAHPLRERFRDQLMLALYRADRQAEALATYRAAREVLVDELGVEPGPRLRELHERILGGDPDPLPAKPVVPHRLPARGPHFVCRDAALAELSARAEAGAGVVVVGGAAGVGKTALAVHWANLAADAFPDGRLYADLRGFGTADSPLPPAEVVRGFLDAFEVPAAEVPDGLAARVELFRRVVGGRRVLVVLDNARDADQVRPLLTAGCFTVVTSRDRLADLVAAGAHPVDVDLLDDAASRALLVRRLGPERLAGQDTATAALVAHCAGLPLALAVVAMRAAVNPHFPLALIAEELADEQAGLRQFDTGDPESSLGNVFSWSYRLLGPSAARLFRLLGRHPGPASASAAAALAGVPLPEAEAAIGELIAARLLTEPSPGRYSAHGLLRRYAAELSAAEDDDTDRARAAERALSWYVHTARNAVGWLPDRGAPAPGRAADRFLRAACERASPRPPEHVPPAGFTSAEDASAWLGAEWDNLVRLVRAATAG
ncbi:BTAD domain-containing putative transcriptional regulator [Saccharothrix sp. HUAS TT1]|uniref:AfsR/SARP family transcriptional regulator n=1 Tax=unclassified Saccharothrix TaxID=2593673 RepID=UPI00345C42BF